MSEYKHKLVNGKLVELTPQEVQEFERNAVENASVPLIDPEVNELRQLARTATPQALADYVGKTDKDKLLTIILKLLSGKYEPGPVLEEPPTPPVRIPRRAQR